MTKHAILPKASAAAIEAHLRMLTETIGVRLAGSDAERAAAEYLAGAGAALPGTAVAIEEFPVWERHVTRESLEIRIGDQWHVFGCSLFGAAPSTEGRVIEAPLVFFDTATGYQRESLDHLKGAAVVHLGCHIETPDHYRRLMAAEPAFLLFVDTRHPGAVPLADGLFPAYVHAYGARPSMNVAYLDAWRWKREGAASARLCVEGSRRKSHSQNVVIELPGREPESGVIYVGGHHDTQAGSVGADDNAVGSASVVELARLLSGRRLRRTVRLISFGAEEQLSVGSAAYVRRHREAVEHDGRFMFNIDGSGSALGWLSVNYNGPETFSRLLAEVFHHHDFYYIQQQAVFPYTDQFPFAAAGVPGLWLNRRNCTSGAFYHHRADDNMDHIDPALVAAQLDAAAAFLTQVAEADDAAFAEGIPAETQREIAQVWNDLYGGWQGFGLA